MPLVLRQKSNFPVEAVYKQRIANLSTPVLSAPHEQEKTGAYNRERDAQHKAGKLKEEDQ